MILNTPPQVGTYRSYAPSLLHKYLIGGGPLERICRRGFAGEGHLEKVRQRRSNKEGSTKKVHQRRPDGEGPSEKMAVGKEGSLQN